MCEQLAQGCYLTAAWPELNSRPLESQANALTITPPGDNCVRSFDCVDFLIETNSSTRQRVNLTALVGSDMMYRLYDDLE